MVERVRLLTRADLDAAMRLKSSAGWNQTAEDWLRFVEMEPKGCFGIEIDGTLAASAGAIRYGNRLAWIGMVLTLPEFRGRGYAGRLTEKCIEFLEESGVAWIKLDATAQGRPIYSRLGFEDECPIERWFRHEGASSTAPFGRGSETRNRAMTGGSGLDPFEFDAELDLAAFGADRRRLIERLAKIDAASVAGQGYAMARPGSEAHYFGPCVSRSPDAARRMLAWGVSRSAGRNVCMDLLPDNREAVALAREFGFEKRRELVRMARRGAGDSEPVCPDSSLVYAIAGFEYG